MHVVTSRCTIRCMMFEELQPLSLVHLQHSHIVALVGTQIDENEDEYYLH
jgi:hypothetical protein